MQWAIPIFNRCHPLLRNLAISRGGGIQSTGNSKEGMNDSWKFQGIRKMVPGNWYQRGARCQSEVTSHFCDICRVSGGIQPPRKMFEIWVSETAYPAFGGHFGAKY